MEFYEEKDEKETIKKQEENVKNTKEEKVKGKHEQKKTEGKKQKNKALIISFVSIAVFFIILFVCTIFSLLNINNTKIMQGVTINEINIQDLTIEEAEKILKENIEKELNRDVNIKSEGFEYSIKLSQIGLEYKINEAVQEAYEVGRKGNIFSNNFNILNSMIRGKNIKLEYSYNKELLDSITKDIALKIPGAVEEVSYYIENEKLYVLKGKSGNTINQEKIKEEILNKINKTNNDSILLEIYKTNPKEIDIEKIYNEVHTEPKDAYYTKEPFKVFPHVNGVDFDIEVAKEILKEDKEEYEIPLVIKLPQITTDQIGTEAFPDLISSFSTRYNGNDVPRTTNLKMAMKSLNGLVLSPGETFSYNKTLGKRTISAGYREAGGYANGRVVDMVGGGICQISSTLYNAVVYANLEIVERHNHMFVAGYAGAGKDATVSYGTLDFKFKNTRKHPIMIKTSIGGGVAKVSIYGLKEEVEYDIEISTKILNYIPYTVVYEEDPALEEGKEKVVQGGANGCKSITYKIVRLNGEEISRTVLSSDTYKAMNKIISKGPTKTVETNTTPQNPQTNPKPQETPTVPPEQPEVPEEKPSTEPTVPEEKPEETPEQTPTTPSETPGENIEQNTQNVNG